MTNIHLITEHHPDNDIIRWDLGYFSDWKVLTTMVDNLNRREMTKAGFEGTLHEWWRATGFLPFSDRVVYQGTYITDHEFEPMNGKQAEWCGYMPPMEVVSGNDEVGYISFAEACGFKEHVHAFKETE